MVISEATKEMPAIELLGIQENLKNSDYMEIKRFRESFDPDEMGFTDGREGV